jgi:arabinan endo-1,5-alpha-L-arabinosidase
VDPFLLIDTGAASRYILPVLMKFAFLGLLFPAAALAQGLDGQIGIHDPSTIVRCNDRFYTYGTGGGSLVSDDGWTWQRGTT